MAVFINWLESSAHLTNADVALFHIALLLLVSGLAGSR